MTWDLWFLSVSSKRNVTHVLACTSCCNGLAWGRIKSFVSWPNYSGENCIQWKLSWQTLSSPRQKELLTTAFTKPCFPRCHTNSVFLHSRKQPTPVMYPFFMSRGCPLTRASTVFWLYNLIYFTQIYWITPLPHFFCILNTHTHTHTLFTDILYHFVKEDDELIPTLFKISPYR